MREPLMTVYRMVGVLLVRPMSGLTAPSGMGARDCCTHSNLSNAQVRSERRKCCTSTVASLEQMRRSLLPPVSAGSLV